MSSFRLRTFRPLLDFDDVVAHIEAELAKPSTLMLRTCTEGWTSDLYYAVFYYFKGAGYDVKHESLLDFKDDGTPYTTAWIRIEPKTQE